MVLLDVPRVAQVAGGAGAVSAVWRDATEERRVIRGVEDAVIMNGHEQWEIIFDMHDEWNAAREAEVAECIYCGEPAILGTWLCAEHLHEYTVVEQIEKQLGVEFR